MSVCPSGWPPKVLGAQMSPLKLFSFLPRPLQASKGGRRCGWAWQREQDGPGPGALYFFPSPPSGAASATLPLHCWARQGPLVMNEGCAPAERGCHPDEFPTRLGSRVGQEV